MRAHLNLYLSANIRHLCRFIRQKSIAWTFDTESAMHIHLWPYKAIYIGISPDNDVHAHHAVQICIGLDKDISVQDYKAQSIHTGQCIVIFEDVPHKVLAQDNQIVVIYLEPEDRQNQQFLTALRQARSDGKQ